MTPKIVLLFFSYGFANMSDALLSSLNTAISKGSDRVGSIEFWRKFLSYVQENADKLAAIGAANQYDSLTKVTPASADRVIVEDASDSFNKKYFEIQDLPSGGGGGLTQAQILARGLGS